MASFPIFIRSEFVLNLDFLMIKFHVFIFAHLLHEELFLLFLFLQKLMVVIVIIVVFFLVLDGELVIEHVFSLCLPCWVVHVWVHQFSFLHFLDDIVDLVFVQKFIDDLFVFWHIPVHEVQASCQDLHLIYNLLEFKGHHLWNYLNLMEKVRRAFCSSFRELIGLGFRWNWLSVTLWPACLTWTKAELHPHWPFTWNYSQQFCLFHSCSYRNLTSKSSPTYLPLLSQSNLLSHWTWSF